MERKKSVEKFKNMQQMKMNGKLGLSWRYKSLAEEKGEKFPLKCLCDALYQYTLGEQDE